LPVEARIESGNDCSVSLASFLPSALLMHPVGRSVFSRHESEIVILFRIKFTPSLVSVSCDTQAKRCNESWHFECKGSKCLRGDFLRRLFQDLKSWDRCTENSKCFGMLNIIDW
jgi:hypothetical protein